MQGRRSLKETIVSPLRDRIRRSRDRNQVREADLFELNSLVKEMA